MPHVLLSCPRLHHQAMDNSTETFAFHCLRLNQTNPNQTEIHEYRFEGKTVSVAARKGSWSSQGILTLTRVLRVPQQSSTTRRMDAASRKPKPPGNREAVDQTGNYFQYPLSPRNALKHDWKTLFLRLTDHRGDKSAAVRAKGYRVTRTHRGRYSVGAWLRYSRARHVLSHFQRLTPTSCTISWTGTGTT